MRIFLVSLGSALLVAYGIFGALLMNDWAVVAASGEPLEQTIVTMSAMGQHYDSAGGWVFALIGIALTALWAWLVLAKKPTLPAWSSTGLWGLLLALGAPAYFFGAFANLNSVGDAYEDWNAGAAFSLEQPLYLASAAGLGLAAAMAVIGIWRNLSRARLSPQPF